MGDTGGISVLHPGGPGPVEQDLLNMRPGDHSQVGSPPHRAEVGVGGALPQPEALGHRSRGEPGVVRPVQFPEPAHPQLGARGQKRHCGRVRVAQLGDELRTRRAVHLADIAAHPVLRPLEVGQHLGIGPARAVLRPAVVVEAVPTGPGLPVDRCRTAQRLAPRPVQLPSGQLRLLGRVIVPVVAGLQQLGERRRDPDLPRPVRPARLQQDHPARRVGRQPVGQHTTRRPRAHDHVAIAIRSHHCSSPRTR